MNRPAWAAAKVTGPSPAWPWCLSLAEQSSDRSLNDRQSESRGGEWREPPPQRAEKEHGPVTDRPDAAWEKAPGPPQQGAWGRAWSLQPVRDQRMGCGISSVKCKGGSRASSVTCSWQCQMACRVRGSAKPRWQGLPMREQVGGRQSSGSCWSWGTPP